MLMLKCFDFFNMVDFFCLFHISRNIPIELNFWLGVYMYRKASVIGEMFFGPEWGRDGQSSDGN